LGAGRTSCAAAQVVNLQRGVNLSAQPFEVAQAVLLSLGGGALIVFALSSFLAKVWAQRILQSEKSEHDKEINLFRSQLEALSERHSLNYQQKLDLYKVVAAPLVELVAMLVKEEGLNQDHLHEFNRQRLHITAQLALFAPRSVFDAFNNMIDYIYDSLEQENYDFHTFRTKALMFISEMRRDIGIYDDDVSYSGHR
jgi:hypothetical protein